MTAELLREAAKVLREHAEAATPGPWAWEATGLQDNSWGLGSVVDADGNDLSGDVTGIDDTEVVDSVCYQDDGHLADPAYIALLHPPVALALADWLDAAADDLDAQDPPPPGVTVVTDEFAFTAGRAILRRSE